MYTYICVCVCVCVDGQKDKYVFIWPTNNTEYVDNMQQYIIIRNKRY